jgi:hypothetical protein
MAKCPNCGTKVTEPANQSLIKACEAMGFLEKKEIQTLRLFAQKFVSCFSSPVKKFIDILLFFTKSKKLSP